MAVKSPRLILPVDSEMSPTRAGPAEQPTSPARANIANRKVPPPFRQDAPNAKAPGHMSPTEKPQIPHPVKANRGMGDSDVSRYPRTQSMLVAFMDLIRSSL